MNSSLQQIPKRLNNFGLRFWFLSLGLLGGIIYFVRLGSFPLWDPWEPHYSQVAWEMQERLTWNNPWYRGIDNWWSKPIFMLWMLRASFLFFWDTANNFADNEWVARLPFALTAVLGGLIHFDWVRRLYGKNVGILAAVALITAPQYLLIGRQVMVDTPFVVAYSASLGYLAVGLFTPRPVVASDLLGWPRFLAMLRREAPFVIFWSQQAIATLTKGFVPPTLAVLVLLAYWIATFRWSDYAELVVGRKWLHYVVVRASIALVVAALGFAIGYFVPGVSREQRALYQALISAVTVLGIFFGVFFDIPPARHAFHLLRRIRFSYGLPLFFLITSPWYLYMTFEHGWAFWNEFIFYHHIGRAAGTIDKPGGTFDVFVKQIGFALFPWSAFLMVAVWRFVARSNPLKTIAERRNLFVLLAAALPYLFFTLSGTKFSHYIFPVVPFLTVMVAAVLIWLGATDEEPIALHEEDPALGPPLLAHSEHTKVWWKEDGAKGELIMVVTLSLISFGILAHDLALDFRLFLRLFIYYYNRATPVDYNPFVILQVIFFPMGGVIGVWLLVRYIRAWHLVIFSGFAVVLACYLGWVTMPAMADTFTYKPMLTAYEKFAKNNEAIGQYNDWQQPERSVIFLFQNRCAHLRTDKQAEMFLKRQGRKFIIVDKNRLADLRRVAKDADVKLYVLFDDHPYARLVSDQPEAQDSRSGALYVIDKLPSETQAIDVDFDGKIQLVGWHIDPAQPVAGSTATVTFFYKALTTIDRDWQIFVHGDGPSGGAARLHVDHFPADGLYPTTDWQEGEIIRDQFKIEIPSDYPFDSFTLWTGWYIDNQRLRILRGANDGTDRARGPTVTLKRH